MATFLFVWELGGGLGHVMPLRPLMAGLWRQGHRVVGAFRDLGVSEQVFGPLRGQAAAQGPIELLQAPTLEGQVPKPFTPSSSFPHLLHNTSLGSALHCPQLITRWRELFDRINPDVMIFDHSPTALIAATGLTFKKVLFGTGFCCPRPQSPFPSRRPECPFTRRELDRHERSVLKKLNVQLRAQGQPELVEVADLLRNVDATLLNTFEELDHDAPLAARGAGSPRTDADTHYVGPWGANAEEEASAGSRPEWPQAPGEKVFLYSKVHPHLPDVLGMLNKTQQPTVAYIPDCPTPLLGTQSATLHIVTEPVDLRHATQECDRAILNAGHGASAEFLLAGVPLLLLPLVLEQRVLAERLAVQKLALCADPSRLMDMVKAWIALNKSPIYAERAGAFANKYRDYSPQRAAKNCVTQLLTLLDS